MWGPLSSTKKCDNPSFTPRDDAITAPTSTIPESDQVFSLSLLYHKSALPNPPTMLYLVGLGLGDETDITLKGLEVVKKSARVYLEAYTSILLVDKTILVGLTHPITGIPHLCTY